MDKVIIINNNRYKIHESTEIITEESKVETIVKHSITVEGSENSSVVVDEIEYDEENKVFRMIDSITLSTGTKVRIIFHLDHAFNYVGLVYNDLTDEFTSIQVRAIQSKIDAYQAFKIDLQKKLEKAINQREEKYNDVNRRMLSLRIN